MITYEFLQQYWWFLIALLGGLLVFLLFVQGGNALIFLAGKNEDQRQLIVNSTGRKWELTFTTLVTFGGAFFASFPLFYSTSFGGAYWVWILILITFVFQAVSYEFQSKAGNILGKNTFRIFLTLNGCLAPLLIGTAVGTFFTGSDFMVKKSAVGDIASRGKSDHKHSCNVGYTQDNADDNRYSDFFPEDSEKVFDFDFAKGKTTDDKC